MSSTSRVSAMREKLAQGGGRRLDLYLSGGEITTLEAYRQAKAHKSLADAMKALIGEAKKV